MPGMMENVSTLNSVVRTFLAVVLVGGAGFASLVAWRTYNEGDIAKEDLKEAQTQLADATKKITEYEAELNTSRVKLKEQGEEIVALNEDIKIKDAEIERQATAMRLLKRDQRLAIVSVLDQKEVDGELQTTIRWVEVNDQNQPIDQPRTFTLDGDIVKVDSWIVKFDDKYIEQEDLIRGTSIVLFKGIYGEFPTREEVNVLDEPGALPSAYRAGQVSDFERQIWQDFWEIANDPEKAEQMGIRAAHGEVVYNKVRPGMKYKIELRASGGLTMKPLAEGEADPTASPAA
jgi:hypothetical protein